jgi:serine/threonine protein kinase
MYQFGELVATMDYDEMVLYMRNLFAALAHIHALGIIHRDVKPANFMYNRARRRFALVDFGLAQLTGQVQERALAPASPACKRRLTSSDLANTSSDLGADHVTPTKRRYGTSPPTAICREFKCFTIQIILSTRRILSISSYLQYHPLTRVTWLTD